MKIGIPENLKTEKYPFRQVAVTSFIIGGITIILGMILLLSVKSDFKSGYSFLAIEKIIAGISLLAIGGNSLWKGYQDEYSFDLDEVFDPSHGENVNYLLGQRANDVQKLANEYSRIMHSSSYNISPVEKGQVSSWQFMFYKLLSRRNISKVFDYVPYPITRFIANQSKPVALLGAFLIILAAFLFISYLDIFPLQMTWINLFILVGLLSLWRPSKIETVTEKYSKDDLRNKFVFFIIFFLVTIFLYQPYAEEVNIGLFGSILLVACIMVTTAIFSFNLIEQVFSSRERVNVSTASINLVTHRASTQPNNILQQFDNTLRSLTGWYFKSLREDARGLLAGDQNRKGEFRFEYVYETQPQLFSTTYDEKSERLLKMVWRIGTGLLCAGIVLIFFGIYSTPPIDTALVRFNPEEALTTYSPKILLSLFLALLGIAIYFFGKKLVYEVYLFFNTEIFFESNLILFNASGNYDEFEQIIGGIKRKDTSTDFTPDIKVCRVISSVFVHPYLQKGSLIKKERFLVKITSNNDLLIKILRGFKENMGAYMMSFSTTGMTSQLPGNDELKKLDDVM